MNIAFIIDKLGIGGTQRQLVMLANRLSELRVGQVTIVCLMSAGSLTEELAGDIEVVTLGLTRIYGLDAARQLWRVRALFRERRVQLVHAFLTSSNIFAAALRTISGVRFIAARRDIGIYPGRTWQSLEERIAFGRADAIACVSGEIRELLLKQQPQLAGRMLVIPNAIDIAAADRLAEQAGGPIDATPYAIAVGNVKAVKGYDLLLDAAPELAIKVVVVGYGAELEHYRDLVRQRALGAKIEFVGQKVLQQTAGLIRHAAFAVHPSYSEGMSNAILEFMAHGKAVVCRDLPTNRELVEDGQRGLLFQSTADFVGHINRLSRDAQLRETMGAAARRWVRDHHELGGIVERYIQLYLRLISRHG